MSEYFQGKISTIAGRVERIEQYAVDAKDLATQVGYKVDRLRSEFDTISDILGQTNSSGKRPRLDFQIPTISASPQALSALPAPSGNPPARASVPPSRQHTPVPPATASALTAGIPSPSDGVTLTPSTEPTGDVVLAGFQWRDDVVLAFQNCVTVLGSRAIPRPTQVAKVDRMSMCGRFASPQQAQEFVTAWIAGPINDSQIAAVTAYHVQQSHPLFNTAMQAEGSHGQRSSSGGNRARTRHQHPRAPKF
jgi:hypothetical protein